MLQVLSGLTAPILNSSCWFCAITSLSFPAGIDLLTVTTEVLTSPKLSILIPQVSNRCQELLVLCFQLHVSLIWRTFLRLVPRLMKFVPELSWIKCDSGQDAGLRTVSSNSSFWVRSCRSWSASTGFLLKQLNMLSSLPVPPFLL